MWSVVETHLVIFNLFVCPEQLPESSVLPVVLSHKSGLASGQNKDESMHFVGNRETQVFSQVSFLSWSSLQLLSLSCCRIESSGQD